MPTATCEIPPLGTEVSYLKHDVVIPSSNRLLTAAVDYATRGWRVFPLYEPLAGTSCSCGKPECPSAGKHPRTSNGLKDGTINKEKIREWWGVWPDANIGIVTGAASGLVVFDVDRPELLTDWQDATLAVKTGKGRHFYFQLAEGARVHSSAGKLGAGLDVRGDGAYVVAPPSRHANGTTYEWINPNAEMEIAPPWLLAADPIPQGERNSALFKMAAAARGSGKDLATTERELSLINRLRCSPPLGEPEVCAIAEGVFERYEPGAARLSTTGDTAGMPVTALLARKRSEPDWIIPGLLKRNNAMLVVGEPKKTCKSWLLANLAWDLSEGKPVWGIKHTKKGFVFEPTKPMRVVYFSQEDAEDDFQDRAELLRNSGRVPNENFWFVPKNLRMMLDSAAGALLIEQELHAATEKAEIDLVVLDPLRRILQGDESDSAAIARMWKKLDEWSKKFNCAFIIAHHVVKPPRQKGDHYDPASPYVSRGSGDIYGGADAFINVVPGKERGQPTGSRLLELHFTTKRSREIPAVKVRVNFETGNVRYEDFLLGRGCDPSREQEEK
jgi:hypothetical protein